MKIFRTSSDYEGFKKLFPESEGLFIRPVTVEGFSDEMHAVEWHENNEIELFGLFCNIDAAYFYAVAWNTDILDINYDDIEYVGD